MTVYATDTLRPWWHWPWFWFRWLAFIPGGIAGGMLAAMGMSGMAGVGELIMGGTFMESPWTGFVAVAFFGVGLVFVGSHIAPTTDRRAPAITMAVIGCLIFLPCAVLCITGDQEWFKAFHSVVALVCCIGTAVAVYRQSEDEAAAAASALA